MSSWEVIGADRTTGMAAQSVVMAATEAEAVRMAGQAMLIEKIRRLPDLKPALAAPVAASTASPASVPAVSAPALPYTHPQSWLDWLWLRPRLAWTGLGGLACLATLGVLAIFGVFRAEKPGAGNNVVGTPGELVLPINFSRVTREFGSSYTLTEEKSLDGTPIFYGRRLGITIRVDGTKPQVRYAHVAFGLTESQRSALATAGVVGATALDPDALFEKISAIKQFARNVGDDRSDVDAWLNNCFRSAAPTLQQFALPGRQLTMEIRDDGLVKLVCQPR